MKTSIVLILLVVACAAASAESAEASGSGLVPNRSIFSIDVGFVSDGHGGRGYAGFIKSATFLDDGPIYYGFGSLFGGLVTIGETFFETGLLVGYNRNLAGTGLDLDAFVDLLVTGGRINQDTLMYQAQAPALHLGLSLGFFAPSDIDCAISVAPVIRPFNLQKKAWDFSGSYVNFSFALRFKSYVLVQEHRWSESISTTNAPGRDL